MTNYPIKINGVQIKTPNSKDFQITKFNLTKAGRVSSGKMTLKFIAKKVKLILAYPAMRGAELDLILDEIDTNAMFFTVSYYDRRGTNFVKTFYTGAIPATQQRRGMNDDNDVWADLEFHFIEQ